MVPDPMCDLSDDWCGTDALSDQGNPSSAIIDNRHESVSWSVAPRDRRVELTSLARLGRLDRNGNLSWPHL